MKVLFVAGSIPPEWCGVGDYTSFLVSAMASQPSVEAGILTARGEMHDDRVTVLRTKDWAVWRSLAILRTIRSWKPDVVHFQYPTAGYRGQGAPWLLPLLCRLAGLRVLLTWHEERPRMHPVEWLNAMLPGGVVIARPELPDRLTRFARLLMRRKTFRYIAVACTLPVPAPDDAARKQIRAPYARDTDRLLAFFGFAYPHKRIEDLFAAADPAKDVLVLICTLDPADDYQRKLLELAAQWKDRCIVTGPLAAEDAASILAVADAVVFPFEHGAGPWNTSLRGARMQGTFALTTALDREGYDDEDNVAYVRPGDVAALRAMLDRYAGTRRPAKVHEAREEWLTMAREHLEFYRELGLA